jgi:endopeptidase La
MSYFKDSVGMSSNGIYTHNVKERKAWETLLKKQYPSIRNSHMLIHEFIFRMTRFVICKSIKEKGEYTAENQGYYLEILLKLKELLTSHRSVENDRLLDEFCSLDAMFLYTYKENFSRLVNSRFTKKQNDNDEKASDLKNKKQNGPLKPSRCPPPKPPPPVDDDDDEEEEGEEDDDTVSESNNIPYIQIISHSGKKTSIDDDFTDLKKVLRLFKKSESDIRLFVIAGNKDEDEDDEDDEDEEDYEDEEDEEDVDEDEEDDDKLLTMIVDDDDDDDDGDDDASSKKKRKATKEPKKTEDEKNKRKRIETFSGLMACRSRENYRTSNVESFFTRLSASEQEEALSSLGDMTGKVVTRNYPVALRILLSGMPTKVKEEVLYKYENSSKREESGKFGSWLDAILNVPFGKFQIQKKPETGNLTEFFQQAQKILDTAVAGHTQAKHKLLQYLGQLIRNPDSKGTVLGIEGPMGVGKTTLVEKGVAKILGLPFFAIPLGGASDASFLNGHSYTYEGSVYGQIVDVLIKSKVMNPIIYFDELDKVSDTHRGQEIINLLIHMIDPAQNNHFQDRYFGNIDIDLSRCIFIFSYNDASSLNPILRDRIFEVKASGFTTVQKISIAREHLIPQVLAEVGLSEKEVSIGFSDACLEYIISKYTFEGGVRKLKECLLEICREVNLELLMEGKESKTSSRKRVSPKSRPVVVRKIITVTEENLRIKYLKHRRPVTPEKIHSESTVGRINGLYATMNETGGIIPIETSWLPSDQTMMMSITGNLGKVMTESTHVSRTLAWNLTNDETQKKWLDTWNSTGKMSIHVHCPDGSIQKEGPSAGVALTVVIYSLLNKREVKHFMGVTGEINLSGEVMAIGGLREKLYGARAAGITHVLFPKQNLPDYEKILLECPDLHSVSDFKATPISTIQEAISLLLVSEEGDSSATARKSRSKSIDSTNGEIATEASRRKVKRGL